jgi:Protein of unknown function (DUF2934)
VDMEWEEQIRVRAYYLWEQEGRPEGSEAAFWAEAERQLRAEASPASAAGTETWTDPGGSIGGEADPSTTPAAPEPTVEPEAGTGPDTRTTGGILP